ncbi:MAG TPA: 2-oxoacid:acceptor oxidoreductase subunit alpha [Vicinamibacterales bacterium]|nr:2-oxoacid:acceptor oxidoreductase subunit alpha [Vicinamibacterales bacterium]
MTSTSDDLLIGMAGAGGDGIVSAGESLITAAALEGYHAILTKSFGPQIRGGESSFRLRVSTGDVLTVNGELDVAVALNWDDFMRFGSELPVGTGTVVIYDAQHTGDIPLTAVRPREIVAAPIAQLARDSAGTDKAKNTVVLGLMAGWFGFTPDALVAGIRRKFAKKGDEVVERNARAFAAGLQYAGDHPLTAARVLSRPAAASPKLLTDGNEMCGAAAIFSGCTFFGGYPITPSTEIMHYLGRELWKHGGVVFQAEDEIAGIGAVVGASFAGKKAMTATSGPGMSLKTEMLGLATIAELPLVCINVQRGGPSTGIPTKSEQSDLYQAVFSAHGDAVRPVLAPTSVADTFDTTVEAFNISEEYQTPVIVLSDGEIAQRKEVVDAIDTSRFRIVDRRKPSPPELESYVRFAITESGVSPISQPGMAGGNYLASGIEHNEEGAPTAAGAIHARMNEKRIRKLAPIKARRELFSVYGPADAPIGLVSWGSVSGVVREALGEAARRGISAKLIVPRLMFPVASQIYEEFFASVRAGLVIEQSHQGQLYRLLRMFVNVPRWMESFSRSGSNPFTPVELVGRIQHLATIIERAGVEEFEPQLD